MSVDAITFTPHSEKQESAVFSEAPITVLGTGIQFGKTVVGSFRLMMAMHEFCDPSDNFLLLSPTYKIMQQSSLPPFLRLMDGRGVYSKPDGTFKMHGGGTCYMRTATDPDSIVGITDVRYIWGDEAGLYPLYFWENIQARAAFKRAKILLTTSPYALNWLYKEIILPKIRDPKARPDVKLIQARSDENPYFPKEEYEKRRATMAPRRFNMMFGGNWDKMEGLVYDCFDDQLNTCDPFTLPTGTQYFAGVDWGHTHPFVILVRAVTPDGNHYQVAEFYKTGLTINDMKTEAKTLMARFDIRHFFCGPDRPENIVELCRAGIPAVPARNDVILGIDMHYELIKSRKFKVFRGSSPYSLDEYEKYHWPTEEELPQDRDDKEKNPVKQDDDCMDVSRYITIMTQRIEKRMPRSPLVVSPPKTIDDKLKMLKRSRSANQRTENWSRE